VDHILRRAVARGLSPRELEALTHVVEKAQVAFRYLIDKASGRYKGSQVWLIGCECRLPSSP
jgi:hypothetical protein